MNRKQDRMRESKRTTVQGNIIVEQEDTKISQFSRVRSYCTRTGGRLDSGQYKTFETFVYKVI